MNLHILSVGVALLSLAAILVNRCVALEVKKFQRIVAETKEACLIAIMQGVAQKKHCEMCENCGLIRKEVKEYVKQRGCPAWNVCAGFIAPYKNDEEM